MKNLKEIWKDIPAYEGIYQVSSYGRIKSLERKAKIGGNGFRLMPERILKNNLNDAGYYRVNLKSNSKGKCFLVHRLVGMVFLTNTNNKRTINHKNGIKTDNRLINLEWNTDLENITHSRNILKNRYNMRRLKNVNTGKIFDNLNEVLKENDCQFSKSHLSSMLNGRYPNKTTYIYIE
jgi:hypothetical protein